AHTSSSAEDGEKKDMEKTRSKGCFICDGPHLAKACPRKEKLDVLETEGESDEVSKENYDEEESEENSDEEESEEESEEEEALAYFAKVLMRKSNFKDKERLRNFPGMSAFDKAQ
ncbi:hypothetical protein FRX31_004449, partial [Thalictrum thalictroides]